MIGARNAGPRKSEKATGVWTTQVGRAGRTWLWAAHLKAEGVQATAFHLIGVASSWHNGQRATAVLSKTEKGSHVPRIAVSVSWRCASVKLAKGFDESASVVVDYGMVSLLMEPSRSVSWRCARSVTAGFSWWAKLNASLRCGTRVPVFVPAACVNAGTIYPSCDSVNLRGLSTATKKKSGCHIWPSRENLALGGPPHIQTSSATSRRVAGWYHPLVTPGHIPIMSACPWTGIQARGLHAMIAGRMLLIDNWVVSEGQIEAMFKLLLEVSGCREWTHISRQVDIMAVLHVRAWKEEPTSRWILLQLAGRGQTWACGRTRADEVWGPVPSRWRVFVQHAPATLFNRNVFPASVYKILRVYVTVPCRYMCIVIDVCLKKASSRMLCVQTFFYDLRIGNTHAQHETVTDSTTLMTQGVLAVDWAASSFAIFATQSVRCRQPIWWNGFEQLLTFDFAPSGCPHHIAAVLRPTELSLRFCRNKLHPVGRMKLFSDMLTQPSSALHAQYDRMSWWRKSNPIQIRRFGDYFWIWNSPGGGGAPENYFRTWIFHRSITDQHHQPRHPWCSSILNCHHWKHQAYQEDFTVVSVWPVQGIKKKKWCSERANMQIDAPRQPL